MSEDDGALEGFCHRLLFAEGCGEKTAAAYSSDLRALSDFLSARKTRLHSASAEDIRAHLAAMSARGRGAASAARALSAFRRFYRHLTEIGAREDDPAARIASPRRPRPLPPQMNEEEVERLLRAPDDATPAGLRDRAMLELMYACGLRVSELVALEIGALRPDAGCLQVAGKGGRERIVPFNETAAALVGAIFANGAPASFAPSGERAFSQPPRRGDEPANVLAFGAAVCAAGGRARDAIAACFAPRVCDSSFESRRRFARRANDARTRERFYDANLHAHRRPPPRRNAQKTPPARIKRKRRMQAAFDSPAQFQCI